MVNYLSIIIAAFVCMVLGFIWYHDKFFGKHYHKLVNWDKKMKAGLKKDGIKPHLLAFLAFLIFGFVFANMLDLMRVNFALAGATQGFVVALGFVVTIGMIDYMYGRRPSRLFIINYTYYAICIILTGLIIGGMS